MEYVQAYNYPCQNVEVNQVHTSFEKWRSLLKIEEPVDQENNVDFLDLSYQTVPSMPL
jgi:hypothetical protein